MAQHYTLGNAFTAAEVDSTAELMAIDPIAYALARIDSVKGAVDAADLEDEVLFERRYRRRARDAYARRVAGREAGTVLSDLVADTDLRHAHAWREAARRPSDDDIIRGFISMGAGSRNRPDATVSEVRAGELEDLVARILPHPRKAEFVERLQSEQEFARTSQLLDPVQRERAKTIAAVIPPMAEALEIAEDPDVFALLEVMQDAALRELTLALLKDPGLVDRVEEEKLRLAAERLAFALDAPQVEALGRAWDHESAGESGDRHQRGHRAGPVGGGLLPRAPHGAQRRASGRRRARGGSTAEDSSTTRRSTGVSTTPSAPQASSWRIARPGTRSSPGQC